jgi:putative transcriptional regulator
MRWNLRLKAAERGIWKSTEMRRRLADAGLVISAGKMSALWTTTPTTVRLDDLEVFCAVLDCSVDELLIREPQTLPGPRADTESTEHGELPEVRLGRHRSVPPA